MSRSPAFLLAAVCSVLSVPGAAKAQTEAAAATEPPTARAGTPTATISAEEASAQLKRLTAVDADGCLKHREGEDVGTNVIVVCGRNPENEKYRLPLPELTQRSGAVDRDPLRSASAASVDAGSCGTLIGDTGCAAQQLRGVVGTNRARGVLSGIGAIFGAEGPLPSADYGEQDAQNRLGE
jgi:hypothetical protein